MRAETDNAPVDASATLPDGSKFEGLAGLRRVLLTHERDFVGNLTEKLMTYALGREVEYYDMPAVRKVTRAAAADGYRWSSIVSGIVNSMPFQMSVVSGSTIKRGSSKQ
jgi:hypothetical protein